MIRLLHLIPFLLAITGIFCPCFSQQVFPLPVFLQERLGYNPALVGRLYKWNAIAQTTSSETLRYSVVQADGYISRYRLGAGVLLESYQTSLEIQQTVQLNLAYRLPTRKGDLQFGLAPLLRSYQLNPNALSIRHAGDPLAPGTNSTLWQADFSAGALYKSQHWLMAASFRHLASKEYFRNGFFPANRTFTALASCEIPFATHWRYVPAVYVQHQAHQTTAAYLSHLVTFKSLFAVVQLGLPGSWLAGAGISFSPSDATYQLSAGYTLANQRQLLSPSYQHSVFLSIGFGKERKAGTDLRNLPDYHSPIYF